MVARADGLAPAPLSDGGRARRRRPGPGETTGTASRRRARQAGRLARRPRVRGSVWARCSSSAAVVHVASPATFVASRSSRNSAVSATSRGRLDCLGSPRCRGEVTADDARRAAHAGDLLAQHVIAQLVGDRVFEQCPHWCVQRAGGTSAITEGSKRQWRARVVAVLPCAIDVDQKEWALGAASRLRGDPRVTRRGSSAPRCASRCCVSGSTLKRLVVRNSCGRADLGHLHAQRQDRVGEVAVERLPSGRAARGISSM